MHRQFFAVSMLFICLSSIRQLHAQAISFTTLPSGTTQTLRGVSFSDTATGYACGTGGTILKTVNGGSSWTALTSGTTVDFWDIKVAPGTGGQKALVVGDNNTILKTSNGGTTWTAQTIPFAPNSFVFGIQCLDSLNYFACGGDFSPFSGAVLKTVNGGITWTKVSVTGTVFLDKIFMLNTTTGFSAGTSTGFTDGSIQKTTTGSTYTQAKTSPDVITNLWCNSATNVVAVGLAGQIWKTTNAGASWASTSFNSVDLYGIQFRDSLHGFACGGSPTGSVILSTSDGGLSWAQIPFAFNGALQSICIVGNRIFIVGDAGLIIKSSLPPATSFQETVSASSGASLYPNPVRGDVLYVRLPAAEQGNFSVTILDITGRKWSSQTVCALMNNTVPVDVRELPEGTYLLQLSGKSGLSQFVRFSRP